MQLQPVGHVLADYGDAVALGNVLPLTVRGAMPLGHRQSQTGEASAPTAL